LDKIASVNRSFVVKRQNTRWNGNSFWWFHRVAI